jgi:hypothetical protein
MKWRWKKVFRLSLISICVVGLAGFFFSLRFPHKIGRMDDMRIFMQERIIRIIANIPVDDTMKKDILTLQDIQPFLDTLQAGDIISTSTDKYLSSRFIPLKWKHIFIYI